MAKGANGTIKIHEQTINQRAKFAKSGFENFGVAKDRVGNGSLFPDSPINTTSDNYSTTLQGVAAGAADIYEVYANVIDPAAPLSVGFGFTGTGHPSDANSGKAYLNYRHPNNPFLGSSNYKDLTTGSKNPNVKTYVGFPDLEVHKDQINNPSRNGDQTPASNLTHAPTATPPIENPSLSGDGASYGSTAAEYRDQLSGSSMLGKFLSDSVEGTGTSTASSEATSDGETLGTYFRTNYTS